MVSSFILLFCSCRPTKNSTPRFPFNSVAGGSGDGGGGDSTLDNDGAYEQPRRPSLKAKIKALKAASEAGASATASTGSGHSVMSEASEGKGKRGRRFGWGRSAR